MLDKLSKQLEKMLLLPGKFAMYLTHVFMELWPVLGGLKERNLAKKFIWKMIVFYQLSNQTTKEPNNNNKSTHNQSVLPLQQQRFRMSIQKSDWIIHIHFPIWDDILKMYLGITTTWSDLKNKRAELSWLELDGTLQLTFSTHNVFTRQPPSARLGTPTARIWGGEARTGRFGNWIPADVMQSSGLNNPWAGFVRFQKGF